LDTTFLKLNHDWNAEPNAPAPEIEQSGSAIVLRFYLNHQIYPRFVEEDVGALIFVGCRRWRLGPTNDEGWYTGQCRYSGIAPKWGEFYEVIGNDPVRDAPDDWHRIGPEANHDRHFLFYLRDHTFECMAADWSFQHDEMATLRRAQAVKAILP
jgi:hypothetical protein